MAQRVAWITGASSGIGHALALRMARSGMRVAASARRPEELDALARQAHGILPVPLDVTDRDGCNAAVPLIEAELGPIDQAVFCAGTHTPMRATDFCADAFATLAATNLTGTANVLAPAMHSMMTRRRGRIAIISSLAGYIGLPTAAAYGATKAALINMAEALRPDLARHGVTLQLVCPGFVETPLTAKVSFEMPFLMPVETAIDALMRGLASDRFEIVFPRRLAWLMKLLRLMPYPLAFAVTRRLLPQEGRAP